MVFFSFNSHIKRINLTITDGEYISFSDDGTHYVFSDEYYYWYDEEGEAQKYWVLSGTYPTVHTDFSDSNTIITLSYEDGSFTKIVADSDGNTSTWITDSEGETEEQEKDCFLF